MAERMSEQAFGRLAKIYGSSLLCWPENVRPEARAFLQHHGQKAQQILNTEQDVDNALAQAPQQKTSRALQARLLQSFDTLTGTAKSQREQPGWLALIFAPLRLSLLRPAWGMALALLLIFGFVGGYTGYARVLDKTSSSDLLASAFGGGTVEIYGEDMAT